mgnify:CR=1 FL=1
MFTRSTSDFSTHLDKATGEILLHGHSGIPEEIVRFRQYGVDFRRTGGVLLQPLVLDWLLDSLDALDLKRAQNWTRTTSFQHACSVRRSKSTQSCCHGGKIARCSQLGAAL